MAFLSLRYHQAVGIPTARDISAVNTTIKTLEQILGSREIIDGKMVEDITAPGTSGSTLTTTFNHGLGRKVRGTVLVKSSGMIFPFGESSTEKDLSISYVTSDGSDITFSLWVF